jgi:hypothetical protein
MTSPICTRRSTNRIIPLIEVLDDRLRTEADTDRKRASQKREHRERYAGEIERQQYEREGHHGDRPAPQRAHALPVEATPDHPTLDLPRQPSNDPISQQEQKQRADALADRHAARNRYLLAIDDRRILDREQLEFPDRARRRP